MRAVETGSYNLLKDVIYSEVRPDVWDEPSIASAVIQA